MMEQRHEQTKIVVMSGGLDSTVALWQARQDGGDVRGISFDYGQRHRIELDRAQQIANRAGVPWDVVTLSDIGRVIGGSALTDTRVEVPSSPYDGPTMDATVVPMRNAVILSVAAGVVASLGGGSVITGVHGADHALYPDCRPEFIDAIQHTITASLDGVSVVVQAPFLYMDKADIVSLGVHLGAPLDLTWSCYRGEGVQCGRCGTCRERRRAFEVNGLSDPTVYRGKSVCIGDD